MDRAPGVFTQCGPEQISPFLRERFHMGQSSRVFTAEVNTIFSILIGLPGEPEPAIARLQAGQIVVLLGTFADFLYCRDTLDRHIIVQKPQKAPIGEVLKDKLKTPGSRVHLQARGLRCKQSGRYARGNYVLSRRSPGDAGGRPTAIIKLKPLQDKLPGVGAHDTVLLEKPVWDEPHEGSARYA